MGISAKIARRPDSRPRTVPSPTALSGLALWLEADAITGVANGGSIASWPDQSSAVAHAVQATGAAQPTLNTSGLNGHPTVRFAGAAYMDSPALASKPFTRVLLVKVDTITRSQTLIGGTASSSLAVTYQAGLPTPDAQLTLAGNGSSYAQGYCNTANGVWSVVVVTVDSTGNATFTVDGVLGRSLTSTYGLTGANPTRIGADFNAAGLLIGDLAAVITYNRVLNATERVQIDGYLRGKYGLPSVVGDVQTPPTYDGIPSINHPSAIDFGYGNTWNGYRYWMAYAPFPFDPRENPSVAASNDGRTWVVPAGVTNPLVPLSEVTAAGYALNSDPCILMNSDGVTMEMYARYATSSATLKEAIIRTTSTDGWATRTSSVIVLSNTGTSTNNRLLSPAVVNEGGTNRSMWVVNYNQTSLDRWSSTDSGVTWSAQTSCTMPTGIGVWWHVDVQKVSGSYYMLLTVRDPFRLRYLISSDGLNWAGTSADALSPSGTWVDAGGFYKSGMYSLGGGQWSLFATAMSNDSGFQGIWPLRQTTVTLPTSIRPEAPSAPAVVRGTNYVLTWTAPAATGGSPITDYNVYRNGTFLAAVGSATTTYTDTSPVSGANYTVSAVNANGEGPQSFLPSSLTSLAMWFDAGRIAGLSDGAAVSSWTDLSSSGHTATQATGSAQPLYKTSIINGHPAVRFDGTNDELTLGGADINAATMTVFMVAARPVAGSTSQIMLRTNTLALQARFSSVNQWGSFQGADTPSGSAISSTGTQITLVYRAANSIDFRTDRASTTSSSGSTVAGKSPGAIGSNGGNVFSQVDIGEVLYFTRILNTTERTQVESYLRSRWGTP